MAIPGLAVALVLMLVELGISRRHERALLERGAVAPARDVYRVMAWAYPMSFLVMAGEGLLNGRPSTSLAGWGAGLFVVAKGLKYWAMRALGVRWTFRVLVVPGGPLVTTGPYALMRHPNYLAVLGELAGFGLAVGSPVAGVAALAGFGLLLRRRIAVEEEVLRSCS